MDHFHLHQISRGRKCVFPSQILHLLNTFSDLLQDTVGDRRTSGCADPAADGHRGLSRLPYAEDRNERYMVQKVRPFVILSQPAKLLV